MYFAPTKPSLLDILSLVASALKIERANDGCVGGPAGSPWSRFKQSFIVQGMCVCVCVCVCLCALMNGRLSGSAGLSTYLWCAYFGFCQPFPKPPTSLPEGWRVNTQRATCAEAPSAQMRRRLSAKEQTDYSPQIPNPFILCVCT